MRKINYAFIILLILVISLSGCAKRDKGTQEGQVTVTQPPVQATITPAVATITPAVTITPTQIPPTVPADEYTVAGYTPLGLKLMKQDDAQEYADYVFLNQKEGWKAVYDPIGMFKEGITLYQTKDGGSSWSKLTSTDDDGATIPLASKSGLIFTDSQQGWMTVQIPQSGYVGLYKTEDGGSSWKEQEITVSKEYANAEFMTYPPAFFSAKDGLLLTYAVDATTEPVVFVTHDGGSTWKQVKEKEDNSFQWSTDTSAAEDTTSGWTVVYNNEKWVTADGVTWEK